MATTAYRVILRADDTERDLAKRARSIFPEGWIVEREEDLHDVTVADKDGAHARFLEGTLHAYTGRHPDHPATEATAALLVAGGIEWVERADDLEIVDGQVVPVGDKGGGDS
jgi:hypothetical protein